MGQYTIDGRAEGIRAASRGIKDAITGYMRGDAVQQQAYLDAMGKMKHAEEARALRMTNDFRENADRYSSDESLTPHHRAAMLAFKLLGADADKFSRAASIEQEMGHRESVIQDPKKALPVAQAYFATSGKAPFDNVGNTGHSINQTTGEQIVANPAIAKLFQSRQASGGKAPGLTLSQQRGNAEIDAARDAVSGLTPEEVRSRTAKTTDTGRDNPNYDSTLARSATLAGRRKIGADQAFDNRNQKAAPQPAASSVSSRFQADPAMKAYKLGGSLVDYVDESGKRAQGYEVNDSNGKLIGHYR